MGEEAVEFENADDATCAKNASEEADDAGEEVGFHWLCIGMHDSFVFQKFLGDFGGHTVPCDVD